MDWRVGSLTKYNDAEVDAHFRRRGCSAARIAGHLARALNRFVPAGLGPIGMAVIFGVDESMDMRRTWVNVIGNCLATVVVARWEREFDDNRARVFGTKQETELDLKSANVAFADAVAQGD